MTELDFDDIKATYDRDGFVVLRAYLTESEVDELRSRAEPLAKSLLAKVGNTGKYRNMLKSLNRHDPWFKEQLEGGRQLPLMRHLIGDDAVGASAAWFDRPEGQAQGIEPHLDALGRDAGLDFGATIWMALDPVNTGNGCLYYLKGSHRETYPNVIPIPGIDTESEHAVAAELQPGDAVVHNARAVHWSGGNETGAPRRAVSYFYFGATAHAAHQRGLNDKR